MGLLDAKARASAAAPLRRDRRDVLRPPSSEASAEIHASAINANGGTTATTAEAIAPNVTGADLAEDSWGELRRILTAGSTRPAGPTSRRQSIAASIAGALADGARRERDAGGYLALVRPDGRRLTVAQRTVDDLAKAGLLPLLPQEQGEADTAHLQRPQSWSEAKDDPSPGAWCGCCGRFDRSGGRWWREAEAPLGWRCWTCHPPEGRPETAVVAVRT